MLFNGSLKKKVSRARGALEKRLQSLRELLSRDDLNGKLRKELEQKERQVRHHLAAGIHELNGGAR